MELGGSKGYSSICLTAALADGTRLTTVDDDLGRAAEATENIATAGLPDQITQITGDGLSVMETTTDEAFSFVFLDAERSLYVDWWPQLQRALTVGGLLAVDNVLSHADQILEFRAPVDGTEN